MKLWVPTQNEKQKSPTTYSLCTEIVGTRLSCAVTARLSPRASSTSTEKSPGTRFYDTPMLYLTIALLIVAAIAAGYAVKQTKIAKAMQEKHDDEQTEVRDWQVRHEVVAIQLTKINPLLQMRYADGTTRVVYIDLLPDPALQQVIETYIVEPNRPHT